MKIFPILPLWLMIIVVFVLLFLIWKKNSKKWLDVGIIVLLFLINLRIMIPNSNMKVIENDLDVLFVIDKTISMNAEDYQGSNTRLEGVKKDCKYIVKRLNGARFSVITFDNNAKLLVPFTRDVNMVMEAIDIINPIDEIYARGSSLNEPLEVIVSNFASSLKMNDRKRVIFFISDGEITNDDSLKSYVDIKKYLDDGAVLGYGTVDGGYMRVYNKYSDTSDYVKDTSSYNYDKAISKIDEGNLNKIAKDMGISYIKMDKQSNINVKLADIDNLVKVDLASSDKKYYKDIYFVFVWPLFVLLLIKFYYVKGGLW